MVGDVGTKRSRTDDDPSPEENLSKISVPGNAAGLILTLGMVAILLAGVPPTRWFLAVSVPLGVVVALILRWTARDR
jgi:hypothetical protein